MISDIMMVMDRVRTKRFNCEAAELLPLCSRYYKGDVPHRDAYEKKLLIAAMLYRLKKNFEMLRANVALKQ